LVLIAALALIALSRGISEPPLIDWDEATYAQVAHEALARGEYAEFTWNGDVYVKKPPLLFWMIGGTFTLFGENEFAARLPSVLLGTATVILIYLSAVPVAGRLAGTLAALVPFSFYFFLARAGRECATDAPLLFFTILALFAFDRARHRRAWLFMAGIACGFALLSKGLAGAIPLIVAGAAVAVVPAYRSLGVRGLLALCMIAGAVAAPWYLYQIIHHREVFLSVFIGHETLARLTRHLGDTPRETAATLKTFGREVAMLWPIAIPFALMIPRWIRGGVRDALGRVHPTVALWCVWLVIALGAALAVQTKLPWYVLPSLIPTALICGSMLGLALSATAPRGVFAAGCAALLLLVAQAPDRWRLIEAALQHQRHRSTPAMVIGLRARSAAAERGGGRLVFAGVPLPTLVYYSGLRCDWVPSLPPDGGVLGSRTEGRPELKFHDLVLIDASGEAITVANLGDEWESSGPDRPNRAMPRIEQPIPPENAEQHIRDGDSQ
jgi:4-amino-4-deoxy-L-arabinose transferase-like glycosyltransferase